MRNLISIKRQGGLTFIELMTTLTMLMIVSAIALPSFRDTIAGGRQTAQKNYVIAALQLARSESVKRGIRTVMCTSSDGGSCDGSSDWDSGWIIFVDEDANDTKDTGDAFLQVGATMDTGFSLIGSTDLVNMIRYDPNGDSLESGTLTLCDPRGETKAVGIIITASGRPKVSDTGAGGATLVCPP